MWPGGRGQATPSEQRVGLRVYARESLLSVLQLPGTIKRNFWRAKLFFPEQSELHLSPVAIRQVTFCPL